MMRRVTDATLPEPNCGLQGNDLYFDAENNSAPQPAYNAMLTRGWKAINPDNWGIPGADTGSFNPCAEGEAITLTNLSVDVSNPDQIKVNWITDKDSTSQVIFENVRTGNKVTVNGGRELTKNHEVILPISSRADEFRVTAVSISADLGKVISDPVIAPLR